MQQSRTNQFRNLGQSLVNDTNGDLVALQLLNAFNGSQMSSPQFPQQMDYMMNERLQNQIKRQNQLIQDLHDKIELLQPQNGVEAPRNRKNFDQHYPHYPPPHQQFPRQLPLLPPPPIFLPPNFSFMQQQEQEKQQKDKLRLLLMMKKLRDENLYLKMQLERRGEENQVSYNSGSAVSSSTSRSQVKYKQQVRPKGPSQEDLNKELNLLKQLVYKKRSYLTEKIIRKMADSIFLTALDDQIQKNTETIKNNFPQQLYQIIQNLEKAVAAKFTPIIVELKAAKNLTLFFDLKTSEAERKKRVDALQVWVAKIMRNLDDFVQFPQEILGQISMITHSYFISAPYYYLQFEVDRLSFTAKGGTQLTPTQGRMMVLTLIVVRVLLPWIAKQWVEDPAKKVDVKIIDNNKKNIQYIVSLMYIFLMDHMIESFAVQKDNLKMLPLESKPTLAQQKFIKVDFVEREQDKKRLEGNSSMILIHPLLEKQEFQQIFTSPIYPNEIKAYYESWSTNIFEQIDLLRKQNLEGNNEKSRYKSSLISFEQINKEVEALQIQIQEQQQKVNQVKTEMENAKNPQKRNSQQ